MKLLKVATAAVALAAMAVPANALTFIYTGALATYVVPADRWYELTVGGAQGGYGFGQWPGGGGALITAELYLHANTVLTILAGEQGGSSSGDNGGGGGGMSFVSLNMTPLVVAGGGGGASWNGASGGVGQIGRNGQGVFAGTDGFGGTNAASGAGWYGDGAFSDPSAFDGAGGRSWPSFAGGEGSVGSEQYPFTATGGFGGFGGGGGPGYSCGGGGGGYSGGSGGASGNNPGDTRCPGGGGGSYIAEGARKVVAIAGANAFDPAIANPFDPSHRGWGEGFVSIEFASTVPEPSTWAMMILGFGLCGAVLRRRRRCDEAAGAEATRL